MGRRAALTRARAALLAAAAAAAAATPATAAPAPGAPPAVSVEVLVYARGSRDPVAGASVIVDAKPAGETDAAGRLSVALAPGRHIMQVQAPGYEVAATALDAAAGGAAVVVRLEPVGTGPRYETVVRPASPEAPRVSLGKEEMTTTPGSLGDPFRVIESLPGVAPIVWPLPVYAIRGANPGNTGFFLDGLRVPALFHFALGPAVVHPHFLEGLDFYPGGAPARYGRYVSGIVAAATAAPPSDRVRGSIDVRLFDAGAILSVPIAIAGGAGTVAAAGRYAYPAGLFSALQDDVNFQYWDYQLRADHTLGPGRLTLFAFGSYDVLEPRLVTGANPTTAQRLELEFHRIDARFRAGLGPGRLSVALGAGIDETTTPFQRASIGARGASLLPRASYQASLGRAVELEAGADAELVDYETTLGADGPSLAGFARPRDVTLAGAHGSLVIKPGDALVIAPGIRVDAYEESEARAVEVGPRLQIRARPGAADVWLKASGARMSQMPSLPLQLPGFEGFGLADLGLQTSWQGAAGVEAGLPRALALDATLYVQRYVLTDVRDPELGDPFLDDFLASRDALSYGLELMIRRPITERLHGWLAYTLSRSLRAFEGGVVGPADWDQRHVVNLVLAYRWRRYTAGARFHLHSGRPVIVAGTSPPDFARLPPFYQLDLRVDRRFLFDRFRLDVYLELVNATLTHQVIALRRTEEGVVGQGFRIVLPSLGVRGEF